MSRSHTVGRSDLHVRINQQLSILTEKIISTEMRKSFHSVAFIFAVIMNINLITDKMNKKIQHTDALSPFRGFTKLFSATGTKRKNKKY